MATTLTISRPSLVVLCGIAGSGKTTWAAARFRPEQVVSSDRVRAELLDDAGSQAEPGRVWGEVHERLRTILAAGETAVCDSTAATVTARLELLSIARAAGASAVLVILDRRWRDCAAFNQQRKGSIRVPEHVLREQADGVKHAKLWAFAERWSTIYELGHDEIDEARVIEEED